MRTWTGRRRKRIAAGLAATALLASGCAGSLPDSGSDSSGKTVVTYVAGKDGTGKLQSFLDKFNETHADIEVRQIELPVGSDQQRTALVQALQAGSDRFDVLNMDIVRTAEFAARGWAVPLDPQLVAGDTYLPATVDGVTYDDKIWAVPWATGGALLYYRKDLVKTPPKTWAELEKYCEIAEEKGMGCYGGQHDRYEGLTVNASEAIQSAGGSVLSDDGTEVTVDSPEAIAGLRFLADSFHNGVIPGAGITWKEDDVRQQFQQGKLLFMRNWAYAYSLSQEEGPDSVVQGKVGVTVIPGLDGPGVSSLGGNNLGVSAFSKHKEAALEFVKWMTAPEQEREWMLQTSTPTAVAATYDDPSVVDQAPYVPALKQSLLTAKPRPTTPYYNDVSLAIQKAAYSVEQGDKTPEQAAKDLQAALEEALSGG